MGSEPRLRAGVPDAGEPDYEQPSPAVDPALVRTVPGTRIGDIARKLRRRPDPDAEPTMVRMFGQFGVFALGILGIMVVLVLPCVVGLLILRR